MKMLLRLLLAFALVLGATGARAAITCTSITSAGFTSGYVANTTVSLQLSFTITCNRGSTSDPTSISYSVKADNGRTPQGSSNRASLTQNGTTAYLAYDLYPVACGGQQWKNNTDITGTVAWAANQTGNNSDTQTFWGCVIAPQNPVNAGVYVDRVDVIATYNPGTGNTILAGSIPVALYAPASCVINQGPGNIGIIYPAFSTVDQSVTAIFRTTCTASMPYTLSVAPAGGTLAGVNYTVTLPAPNATGTGTLQPHNITVTAPAGQAGTCTGATCTQTQTHTLTVTY